METNNINKTTGGTISSPTIIASTVTGTFISSIIKSGIEWKTPRRIQINEYTDSIEMIYKQEGVDYSRTYFTINPPFLPEYHTRVFKIVYSCVDGEWNKSEPIYGKIIPAKQEKYEFED